jgi:hypothetical protein
MSMHWLRNLRYKMQLTEMQMWGKLRVSYGFKRMLQHIMTLNKYDFKLENSQVMNNKLYLNNI